VTFIERKQMSTKTSIKRIALVAAAALTLGGFTAVSANAAASVASYTVLHAYSGTTSSSSQVVGGSATFTYNLTNTNAQVVTFQSSGVGTIGQALPGAYTSATNGTAFAIGGGALTLPSLSFQVTTGAGASNNSSETITVTSAVAGTQTVTATVLDTNGTPIASSSETITWIASSATGISATKSMIYAVPAGSGASCAVVGTNHASDQANVTNAGLSVTSALKTANLDVCFVARDASDNLIAVVASPIFSGLGKTGTSSAASSGYANLGANVVSGTTTITAILTDGYGTTATISMPFTYYSSMASIALANFSYAAAQAGYHTGVASPLGATTTSAVGASTSGLGVIQVIAKDSAGALIDAVAGANLTSPQITVVSDANPSVSVTAGSASSNSAGAAVAFGSDANSVTYVAGWTGGELAVDCFASTKAEKLTITLSALNSSGVRVISAPVTFYCSASAKTVAVTAASSSVDAGATTTLTANVADKYGYPAPDGTAVTFASTGQGVVAPATGSTWNGVAGTTDTNLVNFIAAGDGGAATVTAIAGNYSGTTTISVAGGSGSSSLALDAANAATDAANNAYDEAQNATQAASDALAAVTALSAQVGALIATVKSLAAVVAKIKAKVKA
jgi:hypothetical protein